MSTSGPASLAPGAQRKADHLPIAAGAGVGHLSGTGLDEGHLE
jgi:hypothetical protein